MSAYAALVSVLQLLETILDFDGKRIRHLRAELQSLHEKVILLLDFLESSSACKGSQISELETRMRVAAYEAEDHLDSQMRNIMHSHGISKNLIMLMYVLYASLVISSNIVAVCYPDMIPAFVVAAVSTAAVVLTSFAAHPHLNVHVDDRPTESFACQQEIILLHQVLQGFSIIEEEVTNINEAGGDPGMSAHAALVSLRRILDSVLDSGGRRISHSRAHLECLHEKVSFLLDFIGNTSAYMKIETSERHGLDASIRRAAYKAKEALKRFLVPGRFDGHFARRTFFTDLKIRFDAKLPLLPMDAMFITLVLIYKNSQLIPPSFPVWIQILLPILLILAIAFVLLVEWVFLDSVYALVLLYLDDIRAFLYSGDWPEIEGLPQLIGDLSIIVRYAIKINNASGNPSNLPAASSSSRPDLGYIGKNVVVGLESDIKQIKARLVQDSTRLEVISIVGMGGIGKTTLARKVYDDPDIVYWFDARVWVTVSQEYSLRHVLLCLLDSGHMLTEEEKRQDDDEKLALYLHQYLMHRRYLIVMDDVWDLEIWDFLRRFFPDNDNRSRILITSRLSNVVSCLDSSSPLHHMQCLNEDESWDLLRTTVFGEEGCPLELKSIGREIARRCRGLPLAILVIGGLLYKNNRRNMWIDIADNLNSNLKQTEEQFFEILGLSYNHLPHHLRPCFLYMGSFPGDSEIPVSRLIRLWTAEGFLKPCSYKTLEEVAEEYLKDLVNRNLILVCQKSCNGKIRTCSIHDLLRDVCLQNACEENFLDVVDRGKYIVRERPNVFERRVSMRVDARPIKRCSFSVRSFLFTASKLLYEYDPSDSYFRLVYLRVLDLAGVHFSEFPDQIIRLDHLRYLAFHCDGALPPSMSNLQNLQTIVHHHCSLHEYLLIPRVIWSMPNLRHFYMKPGCYLSDPVGYRLPWKSSVLEHLQTLMGIKNFKWSKGIIKRVPNLKKLGISYEVSSIVDWSAYQLESLVDLHQLESLKIIIKYNDVGSTISHNPPKLAFPLKLKKLTLSGCGIPWASIGALPNLEALKMRHEACSGPSWETVEGDFPQLIFLLLEEISFTRWETDEAHFPRLRCLVIRSCGMLEEIPSAIGYIPTLEMIELVDCHHSAVDSAKEIQEEQESMGNEELKVRVTLSTHIP